jgi:hypothetical protein
MNTGPKLSGRVQRGFGLLTIIVGALVALSVSVAVMSRMRTGSAELEANISDANKSYAAINSLKAALAECVLNYPLEVSTNQANVARATYVLFHQAAANAATSGTLPTTIPGDVPIANWATQLYCPGRNNGAGAALSLWTSGNTATVLPSANRVSLSLRMGQAAQAAESRPGSLYLVVGCGTTGSDTVAKSVLESLGVSTTAFVCGNSVEVLLAP